MEGPVPDDDFFTFRAACRDLLPEARFESVDLLYRTVNTETFDAIRRLPVVQLRQGEMIIGRLRELAARSAGPTETIVAFRAAQAAFFARGVLVNLTLKEPGRHAIQTIGLTPTVATRLRRLVTPELVAAYALSAAHEHLDPSRLTIESITPEWDAVSGPPRLPIPGHGRALMGVHMLERCRRGAKPDDPLFVTRAGTVAKTDIVRRMIDKASDLAEVTASSSVVNSRWHTAGIRAWNVDITEIWPEHATSS